MNIISIGGIPASGKTTLGKELGEKYNCLSLELEPLRWSYFESDLKNNVYKYTNNTKIKEKEKLRDYYLRTSIYEKSISKEMLIAWNNATMNYINNYANKILKELKEIEQNKDLKGLKKFIINNKILINYIPSDISINSINNIIISHALISKLDLTKEAVQNIELKTNKELCITRFQNRENINKSDYIKEISEYLDVYKDCINDTNIINKEDVRIKNDLYNFHLRVVAVIVQNNKYLIQQIDGYDYYILPGGHVQLGENSIDAVNREVKEEVGCDIEKSTMFCLHENFYNKKNKKEHWVETYFKVKPKQKLSNNNWTIIENDKGEEKKLNFKWVSKEELVNIDLKPSSIKLLLIKGKINTFNYIIDEV